MTTSYAYSIDNGELVVIDTARDLILWRGKPKGIDVISSIEIPSSSDCIVLLDSDKAMKESERNLLRIGPNGHMRWQVGDPPPKYQSYGIDRGEDIYMRIMRVDGPYVLADSFLGFLDYIDMESGKVCKSIFLK